MLLFMKNTHEVISAVCLLLPADAAFDTAQAVGPADATTGPNVDECCVGSFRMLSFSDTSRVFLHHWPQPVLQAYLDTGEPHDKAGAYAIQGQGAVLVERVDGSWPEPPACAAKFPEYFFCRPCCPKRTPWLQMPLCGCPYYATAHTVGRVPRRATQQPPQPEDGPEPARSALAAGTGWQRPHRV